MGTIASVMQWHCEKCSLINPTEQIKCLRCGSAREFKPPRKPRLCDGSENRTFKYSTFPGTSLTKDGSTSELIRPKFSDQDPEKFSDALDKPGYVRLTHHTPRLRNCFLPDFIFLVHVVLGYD